jgi:hypothetical protein
MALHRSQQAIDYLLDMLQEAEISQASAIIQSLSLYKSNDTLRKRILNVIATRGGNRLQKVLEEYW